MTHLLGFEIDRALLRALWPISALFALFIVAEFFGLGVFRALEERDGRFLLEQVLGDPAAPVRPVPRGWLAAISLALMLHLSLVLSLGRRLARTAGLLLVTSLLLVAVSVVLAMRGWLLNTFLPIGFSWAFLVTAGTVVVRIERERRESTLLQFGRFVHPDVARQLADGGEARLSGEEREITVMFTDIRGFSALSARLAPDELLRFLNTVLEAQAQIVIRHWGTVDKFIGDGMLAFWGAPHPHQDHARAALEAAREIQLRVPVLAREALDGSSDVRIGIGLHTGRATVGLLGAMAKADYTAIGHTVNAAARIQDQARSASLLVSEATFMAAGCPPGIRDLGEIELRGCGRLRLYALPEAEVYSTSG